MMTRSNVSCYHTAVGNEWITIHSKNGPQAMLSRKTKDKEYAASVLMFFLFCFLFRVYSFTIPHPHPHPPIYSCALPRHGKHTCYHRMVCMYCIYQGYNTTFEHPKGTWHNQVDDLYLSLHNSSGKRRLSYLSCMTPPTSCLRANQTHDPIYPHQLTVIVIHSNRSEC